MRVEITERNAHAALSAFFLHRRGLLCGGLLAIAVAITATFSVPASADTRAPADLNWVATWGTSPQQPVTLFGPSPSFNNQSIRQIVRISVGGTKFRVKLTNLYGNTPLVIGAAHLAVWTGRGSAIRPTTDQ